MSVSSKYVTPSQFVEEFMGAVVNDPGCERKLMLFYVDGEEVWFVATKSEAKVTSIELSRKRPPDTVNSSTQMKPDLIDHVINLGLVIMAGSLAFLRSNKYLWSVPYLVILALLVLITMNLIYRRRNGGTERQKHN